MKYVKKERNSQGINKYSFEMSIKEVRVIYEILSDIHDKMPPIFEVLPSRHRLAEMSRAFKKVLSENNNEAIDDLVMNKDNMGQISNRWRNQD